MADEQGPMRSGQKILDGLREAAAGNFVRVTIDGQTWTRHDAGSPEDRLADVRDHIADLTQKVDITESALREIAEIDHSFRARRLALDALANMQRSDDRTDASPPATEA